MLAVFDHFDTYLLIWTCKLNRNHTVSMIKFHLSLC